MCISQSKLGKEREISREHGRMQVTEEKEGGLKFFRTVPIKIQHED
jgi:hypothetical protein